MARSKHSTALFEVIHSANKPGRVAQSLRTPKWWFKSGLKSAATTSSPAPEFAADEPIETVQREIIDEAPVSPPPPRRSRHSRDEQSSAIKFGFDRIRQEVTFRLRYTTALVTGFAICAIIGLSYVVGRHLGTGPKTAGAEQVSVKELLQQPAHPGVVAVNKPKSTESHGNRAAAPPAANSEAVRRAPLANNVTTPRQDVASSFVPASADSSTPRKAGLNYLVIQIYPVDRKANAEAARDFFTKNGIPCTIEKTGWTVGNWLTLIGTAGFTKISTSDFETYVNRAATVAKTFKTANFDQPKPSASNAYKWRMGDGGSN